MFDKNATGPRTPVRRKARKTRKSPGTLYLKKFGLWVEEVWVQNIFIINIKKLTSPPRPVSNIFLNFLAELDNL